MNNPVDRKIYAKVFSKLASKVTRPLSVTKFISILSKPLEVYGITVTHTKDEAVDPNTINANGFYSPDDDEEGLSAIELQIVTSPGDIVIDMDKKYWKEISAFLVDVVSHEILHMTQARGRSYRSGTKAKQSTGDASYYGMPDEMEAFALNTASELVRNYGSRFKAVKALKQYTAIPLEKSPSLFSYINTFNKDSKILKKFIKQTIAYIQGV